MSTHWHIDIIDNMEYNLLNHINKNPLCTLYNLYVKNNKNVKYHLYDKNIFIKIIFIKIKIINI